MSDFQCPSDPWDRVSGGRTLAGKLLEETSIDERLRWRLIAYTEENIEFFMAAFSEEANLNQVLTECLEEIADCPAGDMPFDPDRRGALEAALAFKYISAAHDALTGDVATPELVVIWDRMTDACREANAQFLWQLGAFGDAAARSRLASVAAKARHEGGELEKIRVFVKDCWQGWKSEPETYGSLAAFARDMISKFPESVANPITVERWVRKWRLDEDSGL